MARKKRLRRKIRRKAPAVRKGPRQLAGKANTSDLMVGGMMDPAEKAADQMAARALSGPAPIAPTAASHSKAVHRKCADCEKEDSGNIRRAPAQTPALATDARSAKAPKRAADAVRAMGGGRQMSMGERAFFEPRFQRDFSDVRIHEGAAASRATRALDAKAFAHGTDIAFDGGAKDQETMAHELAHVAQNDGVARRSCASGAKVKKGSFKIKPIVVADDDGRNPLQFPSTQKLKDIFGKCCLDVKVGGTATIKKTSFKTLDHANGTTTPEADKLLRKKRSASAIEVYIIENFKNGNSVSKSHSGGGYTVFSGQRKAKVVLVEGADPTVLAHEVAHAHGAGHSLGTSTSGVNTVCKPSGSHSVAVSEKVSKEICDKARGSPHTKGAKAKGQCCQDLS